MSGILDPAAGFSELVDEVTDGGFSSVRAKFPAPALLIAAARLDCALACAAFAFCCAWRACCCAASAREKGSPDFSPPAPTPAPPAFARRDASLFCAVATD